MDQHFTDAERKAITDAYIHRVMDNMSLAELCQFMYEKLDEELHELNDIQLESQVAEYAPDIIEDVMFPTIKDTN
jgi:hypothetical protein